MGIWGDYRGTEHKEVKGADPQPPRNRDQDHSGVIILNPPMMFHHIDGRLKSSRTFAISLGPSTGDIYSRHPG